MLLFSFKQIFDKLSGGVFYPSNAPLLPLPLNSFTALILTMATRGHCLIRSVNMGRKCPFHSQPIVFFYDEDLCIS